MFPNLFLLHLISKHNQLLRITIYENISFLLCFFLGINAQAAGSIFNVSTEYPTITIRPNVNFFYPSAGIKITAPGFSILDVGNVCQMANNGFCLFGASPQSPKTLTFSGSGELTFTLCSNGSVALNCQLYAMRFTNEASAPRVYVGNNDQTISLCTANLENGKLDSCVDSGAEENFDNPYGIAFNSQGTKVYVTDVNAVKLCAVDTSTGLFGLCDDMTPVFQAAESIALTNDNTRAYITDYDERKVWLCNINEGDGTFEQCDPAGVNNLDGPEGIALNSDNSRAYIVDNGSESVCVCLINVQTGLFENCAPSADGLSDPEGIALTSDNSRAYISNSSSNTISVCNINSDTGLLDGCEIAGSEFSTPKGIALDNEKQLAYVANEEDDNVLVCDINPINGVFSSCMDSGQSFAAPLGIVFQPLS